MKKSAILLSIVLFAANAMAQYNGGGYGGPSAGGVQAIGDARYLMLNDTNTFVGGVLASGDLRYLTRSGTNAFAAGILASVPAHPAETDPVFLAQYPTMAGNTLYLAFQQQILSSFTYLALIDGISDSFLDKSGLLESASSGYSFAPGFLRNSVTTNSVAANGAITIGAGESVGAVAIPDSAEFDCFTVAGSNYSMAAWYRFPVARVQEQESVLFSQTAALSSTGWRLEYTVTDWGDGVKEHWAFLPENDINASVEVFDVDSNTNWQFICFVNEGATLRKYYIDNLCYTNTADITADMATSDTPIHIGTTIGDSGARSFDGEIASPAIWNRALSAEEVAALYNGGNGLYQTTTNSVFDGCLIGFNLTEGTGTNVTSVTGRNDGTFVGTVGWTTTTKAAASAGSPDVTNALVLVSTNFIATFAPSSVYGLISIKSADISSLTPSTDFELSVSRDGGSTYTEGTLTRAMNGTNSTYFYEATVDVSGQPSGSNMVWKVNGASNKVIEVHDAGMFWK